MNNRHIEIDAKFERGLGHPVRHVSETEPSTYMTISRMRAGETLIRACMQGDGLRVRMLLELGVSPNVRDRVLGYTPLMAACLAGHVGIAKDLLYHGASPNTADAYRRTALMEAASAGHADLVRLLLDAGACRSAVDLDDLDALGSASEAGHPDVVAILNGADCCSPGRHATEHAA